MKGEIVFILSKWVNVRKINSRYTEVTLCISYLRICLFVFIYEGRNFIYFE